jgi:hypothetical protein
METIAERCPHCPVDRGRSCEGLRFRRLCELADPAHGEPASAYRRLLESLAGVAIPVPARGVDDGTSAAPGVRESVTLLRLMNACGHRTARTNCGCAGLGRCDLGGGRDGLVNHLDCFACLRAGRIGINASPTRDLSGARTSGGPAESPLDRIPERGAKTP